MSQDDRPAHQFGERGPRDYNAAGTGILAQYFHSFGQGFQLPGIKSTWELHTELLEHIALNVYEIPYADFDSPRCVTRALYGIGNQVLRIPLTDNPKIVDSTYEQVVSIPKLSTGAPVGGVLRTTRSPHGFCCMRLPLSCFEQSFSQRLTHVRAVQFVTA
jgi:hypothetical protein